jgi:hypothetical protein
MSSTRLSSELETKSETKMDTTPIQGSSVSSAGIFSLKEICMNTLLSREHQVAKEHITGLQTQGLLHDEYRQFKQTKLKSLLEGILRADPKAVQDIIEEYPILLLEKLEEKEFVVGPSGHKVYSNLTPYQVALVQEDTQLAAMIKNQLILVADENKANAEYNEWFKQGWEDEEQKRWDPIFTQLDTLTTAVCDTKPESGDITSSGHPNYKLTVREGSAVADALAKFRSLLDATLNEVTIGRHFNPGILLKAFDIYDKRYTDLGDNWSDPRAMLFWQQVIGSIQRIMPANYVQAFCDGLEKTAGKLEKGEPQGRAFKFDVFDSGHWVPSDFYPLSGSRLGFDFAIYGAEGAASTLWARSVGCFYGPNFEAYVNQKQQTYRAYTPAKP